jgi:hypothetical protein
VRRVREQADAQRVAAALGDAVRELAAVGSLRLDDLGRREVTRVQLGDELGERDAGDDLERVDDVAWLGLGLGLGIGFGFGFGFGFGLGLGLGFGFGLG